MPPAYALVKINPDGTATVITGTQDIGTGTRTVLAQIAAEELGFALEKISVELGDTQTGPYAPLSAGSMTVASVGPAVRLAAHEARQQLLDVAAQVLEVPRESLTIADGLLHSSALPKPVAVHEVLKNLENFMIIGRGRARPTRRRHGQYVWGAVRRSARRHGDRRSEGRAHRRRARLRARDQPLDALQSNRGRDHPRAGVCALRAARSRQKTRASW
jgi:CO/xanthine dehydrogenase Mo-binding subunit